MECADAEVLGGYKNVVKSSRISKQTFDLFADGPCKGVPSRFSVVALVLVTGKDSSLDGLTFRSAYLRQFMPQLSHRAFAEICLGAFHQVSDSRVRHAPQTSVAEDSMIDASSSGKPTRWPLFASDMLLYRSLGGFEGWPWRRMRRFSSPSFELWRMLGPQQGGLDGRTSSNAHSIGPLQAFAACRPHLELPEARPRTRICLPRKHTSPLYSTLCQYNESRSSSTINNHCRTK